MTEINLKNFLNFLFDTKIIIVNVILILLFFSIYPNKEYTKYLSYIDIKPFNDRIDIINFENINTFSPLSSSYRKFEAAGQVDYISRGTIKYTTKIEKLQEEYETKLKQSLDQKVKVLINKYSLDFKQSNILFTIDDYGKRKFFTENESYYDINITSSSEIVDNRIKIFMIITFLVIVLNIMILRYLTCRKLKLTSVFIFKIVAYCSFNRLL